MENKKLKLSEQNQKILMMTAIDEIFDAAENVSLLIKEGKFESEFDITHMEDLSLDSEDKEILSQIKNIKNVDKVIKKIAVVSSTKAFFHFFNILDGTGFPPKKYGNWTFVSLIDEQEDNGGPYLDMLHDTFFDCYHDWKNINSKQ